MAKLILLLTIVAFAYAAVQRELQDIKPGEKLACKDQDGNIHDVGSEWDAKGQCTKMTCSKVSETQVEMTGYSCGVVGGPAHCIIEQDNNKIYPECCAQLKPNCQ